MKRVGQVYREALAQHVKDHLTENKNVFLVSYSRLSSSKMNDFRKNLRSVGAKIFVSRNALAEVALKDMHQNKLAERLKGQIALIWSNQDTVDVCKALVNFVKGCEAITIEAGLLEGNLLERQDVKKLSELPPRPVLLAMLAGGLQSPLTRLAGALSGKMRELLCILKQLSETKK